MATTLTTAQGGYEPVAERLFSQVPVDDERRKLDLVVSVAGQVWG